MFTGLIEEVVQIKKVSQNSNGAVISLETSFAKEVKLGDSISINGSCLTVIDITGKTLSFEISKETLSITKIFKVGEYVNLERAMKVDSRFDGHIISGHIDGIAKITDITQDGFSFRFKFKTSEEIAKYIVKKGSITVNGISLTIADIINNIFYIEIIPHTLEKTNLKFAKAGDTVNIETDILARYIEKFLSLKNNNSTISMKLLEENGYL